MLNITKSLQKKEKYNRLQNIDLNEHSEIDADETTIIRYSEASPQRLDTYLSSLFPETSRSQLKKHIDNKDIFVNNKHVKAGYMLQSGDEILILQLQPPSIDITAENIPLDIIFENDDYAVINKPQGMVVHPAPGNYSGTLVNALVFLMQNLSTINGQVRPGIVHRLDKDTSGLIVIAKNDVAHRKLANQIESKECKRFYYALVEGVVKNDDGVIETNLARDPADRKRFAVCSSNLGKHAITLYKVVKRFRNYTLLECELKTGRTHQIRVHCKYIGHPIVGDPVYGYKKQQFKLAGQLLHAHKLVLTDPKTNERKEFCAPLPDYFESVISKLPQA